MAIANATKRMKQAKTKAALNLVVNAWIGPAVFNGMGILPYMLWGDDDDKKKELLKTWGVSTALAPLNAFLFGNSIISAFAGFGIGFLGAYDELDEVVTRTIRDLKNEGWTFDTLIALAEYMSRMATGVDYNTFVTAWRGIDSMIEDGYTAEAMLMTLNTPNSQLRLLVGDRREGETVKDYISRIMHFFAINDPDYYEYYNDEGTLINDEAPQGMTKKQARDLAKDYAQDYRKDVVESMGTEQEWEDVKAIDDEYTAIVEKLPEKSKAYDGRGNFRTVEVDGHMLTEEEYKRLQQLISHPNTKVVTDVASREKTTRKKMGNDAKYLASLRKEMAAKQAVIDEYNKIISR